MCRSITHKKGKQNKQMINSFPVHAILIALAVILTVIIAILIVNIAINLYIEKHSVKVNKVNQLNSETEFF